MKKWTGLAIALGLVVLIVGMVGAADKSKVYHVCNCKDDCACSTVSKEPGKCKCGKELSAMHLIAVEKDTGLFCRCAAECTCERSKEDPGKCGCGKSLKKVSLKGKYVCACSDNCNCGTISDAPGKCTCGKELKQL